MSEERRITITAGSVSVSAVLNDSKTADAIWDALPLEVRGNRWGDEIYFGIPVRLGSDDPQEVVDVGDLAYWPPGHAFCIFWGPTPASRGNEVRPASPVNLFGKIEGDATVFSAVRSGVKVRVEKSGE
ncbi:MAG: cyclophilin-like fold protein [Limnochordia bacterium]